MQATSPKSAAYVALWLVGFVALACSDGRDGGGDTTEAGSEHTPPAPAWEAPPMRHGDVCADCHEDVVDTYSRTGMARALGPVSPEETDGLNAVDDRASGYRYAFTRDDAGRVAIVESRPNTAHRLEAEIAFAIGAGVLDRSYAAAHGDLLWFAPLEVVSGEEGRHAALAPGHEIRPGLRFDNAITPECLGCHTDTPPPLEAPFNLRPHADQWQPRGISCGACHGSVDEHVEWQDADLAGETPAGDDPVLEPSALTRVQRLSICAACHLQGDARIVLDPGQLGPPPPGGDLLERRAVFVAAEPTQDVGFVSQVERLALSTCFTRSEMVCETCHDPHQSMYEPAERRRVRDACTSCHADATGSSHALQSAPACNRADAANPPATERQDCADCHMRKTGVFDVAEVQVHDHFIRRDPGAPSAAGTLRIPEDPNGNWKRFRWPGEPAPEHVDDPGLWMMAYYRGGHFQRAVPLIDRAVHPSVESLPNYHHVRGALLEASGRGQDAAAAYRRAVELDPNTYSSAVNLGLLLGQLGRPQEGLDVLNELLERSPRVEGALRNRAILHNQLGDYASMARDLEAAHRILPRASVASSLGAFYQQTGDATKAAQWRQEATRLDPARY